MQLNDDSMDNDTYYNDNDDDDEENVNEEDEQDFEEIMIKNELIFENDLHDEDGKIFVSIHYIFWSHWFKIIASFRRIPTSS